MLFGHVRDHQARLLIPLPGSSGPFAVEMLLDTGFEGELALPSTLAANLQFEQVEQRTIALADGTLQTTYIGYVGLEWNEEERLVEVLVLDGSPLIGMLLLEGSHIHIEAVSGGEVVIEPL